MKTQQQETLAQPEVPLKSIEDDTLSEATVTRLQELGISRRRFLSFCAGMAAVMALPQAMVPKLAAAATGTLATATGKKPSVIYMSFQECTGCLESLVNSYKVGSTSDTIENLILNVISLDYQETLMAAAGIQAEEQLRAMTETQSGYVLVVDGSIPANWDSGYFVSGGRSGVARLRDAARNAGLVIAVGTCASFGGLPHASPNPTGAISIGDLLDDLVAARQLPKKPPLINVSGCPPIPEVITGTILYYLVNGGTVPALDSLKRPLLYYGKTVHDNCLREEFFDDDGLYASSFDDANARKGACLFDLGCKGPTTHNACSTVKWNQGTSYPMLSGHGCIGCAEPNFWDLGNLGPKGNKQGFYYRLTKAEDYNNHGSGKACSSCHDGTGH